MRLARDPMLTVVVGDPRIRKGKLFKVVAWWVIDCDSEDEALALVLREESIAELWRATRADGRPVMTGKSDQLVLYTRLSSPVEIDDWACARFEAIAQGLTQANRRNAVLIINDQPDDGSSITHYR